MVISNLMLILLFHSAQAQTPSPTPEVDETEWGYRFELATGVKQQEIDYFKGYIPTVISDDKEIKWIGKGMRAAKNPGSQCFNRAEVWAYEISGGYQAKYGKPFNMVKIFRFFSDQFRTNNKYDWWFHVAPGFFIDPMSNSKTFSRHQLMILDRRAYSGAVTFNDWDRYFFNLAGSKTVSKGCRHVRSYFEYTELRANPQEDCFDLVVPMYVYTPDDFADVEKRGLPYPELKWDQEILGTSYNQASMGRVREF